LRGLRVAQRIAIQTIKGVTMKTILFVLVTALSMNAMALEISTSIKITQANQANDIRKQIYVNAKDDAAVYIATGGKELRPQLAQAIELYRSSNGESYTNMQIAQAILELK
jgi:uncharacterized protein (TIGR02448 family)